MRAKLLMLSFYKDPNQTITSHQIPFVANGR